MSGRKNAQALTELKRTVNECVRLSIETSALECSKIVEYAAAVFCKEALSGLSLVRLCDSLPRHDIPCIAGKVVSPDFSSGFLLVRSMYDCLLEGHFLLLDAELKGCRDVALDVASLHSSQERYALAVASQNPSAIQDQLIRLREWEDHVRKHREFSSLPERIQQYVLSNVEKRKTSWHNLSAADLARKVGIHSTHHAYFYKFTSNHAHSNTLAVEQLGAVRSPKDIDENLLPVLLDWVSHVLYCSMDLFARVSQVDERSITLSQQTRRWIKDWKLYYARPLGWRSW